MKTVLVIDDDPDIRELVAWKLGQAGFAVLAEGDGESGLAAARGRAGDRPSVHPDLVLVDWMMPKLSGIEVCRALREDPATADIPVILLTAKAQESELERGRAAGADDCIVKPFSPREMLKRVEALLARTSSDPPPLPHA
ncbi:MAG TPA: response regulator [Acidimicrobiales bacterium]|nr:response regulator [Acidimicrobiales bacterium]